MWQLHKICLTPGCLHRLLHCLSTQLISCKSPQHQDDSWSFSQEIHVVGHKMDKERGTQIVFPSFPPPFKEPPRKSLPANVCAHLKGQNLVISHTLLQEWLDSIVFQLVHSCQQYCRHFVNKEKGRMDLDRQLAVATQTIHFLGLSRGMRGKEKLQSRRIVAAVHFYPLILPGHQSLKKSGSLNTGQ